MLKHLGISARFLAARPEVDTDRVGLWGSSQGGWTVPRAALEAPETAYIYRLAMDGEAIEAADRLVEPYLDEPWYRAAFGDGPASVLWSETRWGWIQRNHASGWSGRISPSSRWKFVQSKLRFVGPGVHFSP